MPRRTLVAVLAAGLLLAACDHGATSPPTHVADTSAVLEGALHTDDAGSTVTWWFEYGATTALGNATPEQTLTFPAGSTAAQVEATVTGLDEATTHHYRTCVRNARGGGLCGAVQSFTTTAGRDSVHGEGVSSAIPEIGYYVGAIVEASSEPDGSSPVGDASRTPGVHYFRIADEGPVTCLEVEGNRASVGYSADYSMYDPSLPPAHILLHIEDNGAAGDRFVVDVLTEAPTTCPDPDVVLDAEVGETVTMLDGFVVHDHP